MRFAQTVLALDWARTPRGSLSVFGQSVDDTWLQGYSNTMSLTRYAATIDSEYHTANSGCSALEGVHHRYLLLAP